MKTASNWFTVDKDGLAKLLARKGKEFVIYELVQNAWDTGAKRVDVSLHPVEGKPQAKLVVTDDDPDGFKDLAHAWTLFAESEKKGDPSKRGRFNLGEKLVIALCHEATIMTTTGSVVFAPNGQRLMGRTKRDSGSEFQALVRMTRDELAEVEKAVYRLVVPADVVTTFNGTELTRRAPVATFESTLQTEISDEEGMLRRSARKTTVEVYEPLSGEKASIYELGIPVVETEDRWHYNVLQKVPLNADRDNVTPAYLQHLRMLVLNEMHEKITQEDSTEAWVRDASADPEAAPDAVETVMTHRFGKKRVIADPTDPEGTKLAMSKGYTVVSGGSLSGGEWANVKRDSVILPAGQVTPSPKVRESSDGEDDTIPPEKWTPGMKMVLTYMGDIGQELIDAPLATRIVNRFGENHGAWYGSGRLTLNLARLGHAWFDSVVWADVDSLLIHELAHDRFSDHLSHEYHEELCRLGARLAAVALESPDWFKKLGRKVKVVPVA